MKRLFRFQFKSIRSRILAGFIVVFILLLLLIAANLNSIRTTNNMVDDMVNNKYDELITGDDLALNMQHRASQLRGYLLFEDPELKETFQDGVKEAKKLQQEFIDHSTDKKRAQSIVDKKAEWESITNDVLAKHDEGDETGAQEMMESEVRPLEEEV